MQKGRVVVVTGAGGGIGGKIVDHFLANEDQVIGLDRSEPDLEELVASCKAGDRLSTSCVDVTNTESVAAFAVHLQKSYGHVDVLVNCAGYFPVVPFEQMTLAQWQEVIAINLTGTFQVTQTLLPLLKERRWGRIVNIGSTSIFEGVVGQAHYVAAKAGIVGFTRSPCDGSRGVRDHCECGCTRPYLDQTRASQHAREAGRSAERTQSNQA